MTTKLGFAAQVTGICFSPDDRQMVSVGTDGAVFIWNIYADEDGDGGDGGAAGGGGGGGAAGGDGYDAPGYEQKGL